MQVTIRNWDCRRNRRQIDVLLPFSTSPVDEILSRLYVEMKRQVSVAFLEPIDAMAIVILLLLLQPISKTPLCLHFSLLSLALL